MSLTIDISGWLNNSFSQTMESIADDEPIAVNYDPLAFILEGRDSKEFSDNRKLQNKTMYNMLADKAVYVTISDPKYTLAAAVIRKHFRNKIMMVSLKNHHVSPFRTKLDEILLYPDILKKEHIPILLRLPDFYQEDKDMEGLFDNYSSASMDRNLILEHKDDTVQFVKKFTRYGRKREIIKYFFKNADNQLYLFKLENDNVYTNLMEFFANPDKTFGLRGDFVSYGETGYAGFNFYHNAGKNYGFY